jgi:hypothetical protein
VTAWARGATEILWLDPEDAASTAAPG